MVDDDAGTGQDDERAAAIAEAGALGLALPEETIAGVIANRALLDRHRAIVAAALAEGGAA